MQSKTKAVYISESIGSSKNGGVSKSGYDFLLLLLMNYSEVIVISSNKKVSIDKQFLGIKLGEVKRWYTVKPTLKIGKVNPRNTIIYIIKQLLSIFKRKTVNLSECNFQDNEIPIYVNSISNIKDSISNFEGFRKRVCILRGCPESFQIQTEHDDNTILNKTVDTLKEYNFIINVSEICGNKWQEILNHEFVNYYLPNSIDESVIDNIQNSEKTKNPFNNEKFNVVVVGSVQTRKGQDIIVDKLEEIVEFCPNICIHLIGVISKRYGGSKIKLEGLEKDPEQEYIKFHGHIDQPLDYVKFADLALFTSRAEAFPRAVAEYMALGKIILTTDVSGIPEMIKHEQTGLIYSSPDEMVDSLKNIYNNKNEYSILGDNAKDYYYEIFSKEQQIKRANFIFNDINTK